MAVMSHMAGSSGSAKVEVVKGKRTMISKTASESVGGAERRVGGRSRFKKTLVQAAKVSLSLFNSLSILVQLSIIINFSSVLPSSSLFQQTKYSRWSNVLFVNSMQRTDSSW